MTASQGLAAGRGVSERGGGARGGETTDLPAGRRRPPRRRPNRSAPGASAGAASQSPRSAAPGCSAICRPISCTHAHYACMCCMHFICMHAYDACIWCMHMMHAYYACIICMHAYYACTLYACIVVANFCPTSLSLSRWWTSPAAAGFPKGRRRSAPVGASGGSGGRFASGSPPSLPVRRGELIARISCMHIMHA